MKCSKVEFFLADYDKDINFIRKFFIKKHIAKCAKCKEAESMFKKTINILKEEKIPKVTLDIYKELEFFIDNRIREEEIDKKTLFNSCFNSNPYKIIALVTSICLIITLSLFLFYDTSEIKVKKDADVYFFSLEYFKNFWDFSFYKVDENKLASISPNAEKILQNKLKKELDIDNHKAYRIFSLLKSFGNKMKDYCYNYSCAMSALSEAVEKGVENELEKSLNDVQDIQKNYTMSYSQFLNNIKTILDKKEFAKFLMFTNRMPEEVQDIWKKIDIKYMENYQETIENLNKIKENNSS